MSQISASVWYFCLPVMMFAIPAFRLSELSAHSMVVKFINTKMLIKNKEVLNRQSWVVQMYFFGWGVGGWFHLFVHENLNSMNIIDWKCNTETL